MTSLAFSTKGLRLGLVAVGALGVAALAACGGNSNPNSANLPCGAPQGQVVVAYPAPSSTGIPDNFQGVIFASTNGLSGSYSAALAANGSSQGILLQNVSAVSPPFPTPFASPSFANPVYQESSYFGNSPLSAATTYGVYLNDQNSNCTPTLLSTFTSQ
ncbi:MAG: hypothetical protein ACREM2_08985 [Vulcanimicrobiaceae bacterium]